jgi:hypothetical protein
MRRLLVRGARRVGLVAAGLVLAFGVTAVAATPAHAAPEGCWAGFGHYEQWVSYITAYNYWFCENGDDIPRPVSIKRYLQPGVYETVASGSGETTYYCTGTNFNRYHTTNTSDFDILCS